MIPAEPAPTFGQSILAILRKVWPGLFYTGVHTFVVVLATPEAHGDVTPGKVSLKPGGTKLFAPKDLVVQWPGCAGGVAVPKVGSKVALVFLDNDPDQPAIVGFQPLGMIGGKPTVTELDATGSVRLGRTATETTVGSPDLAHLVARADIADANFTSIMLAIVPIAGKLNATVGPVLSAPATVPIPSISGTGVTKLKSQ